MTAEDLFKAMVAADEEKHPADQALICFVVDDDDYENVLIDGRINLVRVAYILGQMVQP